MATKENIKVGTFFSRVVSPEENLLTAILERAALDVTGSDYRLFLSAKDWFRSNRKEFLSYRWIEEKLGFTGKLRKKIFMIIRIHEKKWNMRLKDDMEYMDTIFPFEIH